jgi:hypothetical protein
MKRWFGANGGLLDLQKPLILSQPNLRLSKVWQFCADLRFTLHFGPGLVARAKGVGIKLRENLIRPPLNLSY